MRSVSELKDLYIKTLHEYQDLFGEAWPEEEMLRLMNGILGKKRLEFLTSRPVGHLPQNDLVSMIKIMKAQTEEPDKYNEQPKTVKSTTPAPTKARKAS